ncbi:MAG: crossover junction endodeoxyribonuclease RuvC [Verrucomicrobiae bacterium]|nr:crossover junction endodeoxyribonuclease RuvC [Verrucomicrobiae bacterium]
MAHSAPPTSIAVMGITAKQFAELEARSRKRSGGGTATPALKASLVDTVIIGVDPSLRGTGYGVIRVGRVRHEVLAEGTIKCPTTWEQSRCLLKIATELRDVIAKTHPSACAVEGVFFAQNLKTAIIMGAARGAALVALAEGGIEIHEIATRKVKQAIVGYGGAQKSAVAKMVQSMLHLPKPPEPDAADALALAITYAHEHGRPQLKPRKKI